MTCLEKYMQEHPGKNPDDVINDFCPDTIGIGIMDEPDWCCCGSCADKDDDSCTRCWNREIPGTESTEAPHIKDSGSRTEFPSGAVRDMGGKDKGRCDLMPLDVVAVIVSEQNGMLDPIIASIGHFQTSGDAGCLYEALDYFAGKAFTRENMGTSCCHMCLEVSKHFAEGCEKYGENNWKKGIPVKSYINSGVRHYLKWLRGDKDENHHLAFCWNLMCAIWTCKHKPELNDYGLKECPVCGESLPREAKFCGNCQVSHCDPDEFLCEREEENT